MPAVLKLARPDWLAIVAHALDDIPDEACGLLAADPASDGDVRAVYKCRNAARSGRVYTVEPVDHLKADRDAESKGLEIVGVYHSHTHTEAYPSPTDIAQAPDPGWHYVIVSLRELDPVMRSFRIVDGAVSEEPLVVEPR